MAPELDPCSGREHQGLLSNHTSIFSTKCMCPNDLPGPFQSVAAEPAPGARQPPTDSLPAQDFLCKSQMSTRWACHNPIRLALLSSWPGWKLQENQGEMSHQGSQRRPKSRGSMERDRPVIATDGEEGDVFRDVICKGVENNSRQESLDPSTVVTWRRTGELVADEHQKQR